MRRPTTHVLDPLLFNNHVIDLTNTIDGNILVPYADDSLLFSANQSSEVAKLYPERNIAKANLLFK